MRKNVRILITSENSDLSKISELSGIYPNLFHEKGKLIETPNGNRPGGRYAYNKWQYVFSDEEINKPEIILQKLISFVQSCQCELIKISSFGGKCMVIYEFFGEQEVSLELHKDAMHVLSDSCVNVFFSMTPAQN
jgi:Domain of unknown function (DUF4279)